MSTASDDNVNEAMVHHVAALAVCAAAPDDWWHSEKPLDTEIENAAIGIISAAMQSAIPSSENAIQDILTSGRNLIGRVDPELYARLATNSGKADKVGRLWLETLWACEPELDDALSVWDEILLGGDKQNSALHAALLCASLLRRRGRLLSASSDNDDDEGIIFNLACSRVNANATVENCIFSLAQQAKWLLDPWSRQQLPFVEVVEFGDGPLGILLTKKSRGLVVSNFSSEERRRAGSPRIHDALLAVNGRPLPLNASLNDAVYILKNIGRPVLVAFRRADQKDLDQDLADERFRQQQQQQQQHARKLPGSASAVTVGGPPKLRGREMSDRAILNNTPPLQAPIVEPHLRPLEAIPAAADGFRPELLAGEVVFCGGLECAAMDASLCEPSRYGGLVSHNVNGVLYCTSYRLHFHVLQNGSALNYRPSWVSMSTSGLDWQLPVRCLERFEFNNSGYSTTGSLQLSAKDGQRRHFLIADRSSDEALKLYRAVSSLAFSHAPDAFARAHRAALELGPALEPSAWDRDDDEDDEIEDELSQVRTEYITADTKIAEEEMKNNQATSRAASLPIMAKYSLVDEYRKTVLRPYVTNEYPKRGLRLVQQHERLMLCDTYPPDLVVPSAVNDLELRKVATYRSRGRIPVVIWTSADPNNGATISRSSQPKPGVQNKRSIDDERYLDELRRLCNSRRLVVMDARSKVATQGNRVMGMGTELTRYYEGVDIIYGNIANIHAARDALTAVQALCRAATTPTSVQGLAGLFSDNVTSSSLDEALSAGFNSVVGGGSSSSLTSSASASAAAPRSPFYPAVNTGEGPTWLAKLDGTTWLKQVHSILAAAVRTVELAYYERTAVLVHCSDGWDRTPQITVLALLMLEPKFRTIDGFLTIFQREWVDFGHKFDERCGHRDDSPADQRSPVFLLFVDCVANLIRQFPTKFEFNSHFLLALMDQLFACRFGTFLENCHQARVAKGFDQNTVPFWWFVADQKHRFINPNFDNSEISIQQEHQQQQQNGNQVVLPPQPILPSLSPKNIRFFEEYFLRFDPTIMPPRPIVTFY